MRFMTLPRGLWIWITVNELQEEKYMVFIYDRYNLAVTLLL